jgi:hypothetical protein
MGGFVFGAGDGRDWTELIDLSLHLSLSLSLSLSLYIYIYILKLLKYLLYKIVILV